MPDGRRLPSQRHRARARRWVCGGLLRARRRHSAALATAGTGVKITLLHYHLRPGGVTTVIRNAQRALGAGVLADFGYNEQPAGSRAQFIAEARALMKRLPRDGVLHTHNVGLGKHPRLTYA